MPTARSYRASAAALSAKAVSPEYETTVAQSPLVGPDFAIRAASFLSVARSAGLCPVAPRARRIPSIKAQSSPAPRDVALRLVANFRDNLSAGGVGSGNCELSQVVAALGLPFVLTYTATIYWVFRGKVKITLASY